MIDRRVWVFLVCALACILLIPFSNFDTASKSGKAKPGAKSQDYRWVPEATAAAYLLLAGLVAVDSVSRKSAGVASVEDGL